MKKLFLFLTAVAAGLLLTSQAFAWGPCAGKGRGYAPYRDAGMERLNLTEQQKTKIEALQNEHFKATKPLREKIFDKSVELRRMWLEANPDKEKITATQKELRVLRNDMEDRMTAHKLEIRSVLTPEQNEQLANSGWRRGPGFGPRGGMRGDRDPGSGPGLGMGLCP